MKIKEFDLINIYLSNEEQEVFNKIIDISSIESYNERDQLIIENLVRKNVLIKVPKGIGYLVLKNE